MHRMPNRQRQWFGACADHHIKTWRKSFIWRNWERFAPLTFGPRTSEHTTQVEHFFLNETILQMWRNVRIFSRVTMALSRFCYTLPKLRVTLGISSIAARWHGSTLPYGMYVARAAHCYGFTLAWLYVTVHLQTCVPLVQIQQSFVLTKFNNSIATVFFFGILLYYSYRYSYPH